MKRLFTLLLISFAALSCEMVDEKLDELLGKKDIVVFAEGTELTANVPSKQTVLNYKFESTLDWTVKTDAEWLEIDPMRGKAGKDIKIQIKVAKNKDKEGRTGYADLTLSNNESYRITINQAGEGDENDDIVVDIPNNQIWYTSVDGKVVEPYSGESNNYADALTTFGVNIVSNTYVDGKGVIEFEGDVTIIGDAAFLDCDNIKNIILPNSITTIGGISFSDCDNLEVITIPESVTTIGRANWYGGGQTFRSCDNLREFRGKFATEDGRCLIIDNVLTCFAAAGLTEYVIPHSVTTIGNHAFIDCIKLESITIPDGVTKIGRFSFGYCNSLINLTIPDSVTTIGFAAFRGCSSLTSVTIGDSVTEIGDCAFADCRSLTSVTIPDSVTTIGEAAFAYCSSLQEFNGKFASDDGRCLIIDGTLNAFAPAGLTEYTIPDSVTTIGYAAFRSCSSLTSVTIPDSVTTIGNDAFRSCSSLTSVAIGDSVTTIGGYAFASCSSLRSVTIPDSVTTIGYATFAFCENLKTVYCKAINPPTTIEDNNGYWYGFAMQDESGNICNIDCTIYVPAESVEAYKNADGWNEYADRIVAEGSIPEDTSTSIIRYTTIDGNPITPNNNMAVKSNTYTNGEGVLEFYGNIIGDSAFSLCESLTSVTIGDSVTTIGEWAFNNCRSLTSVTIPDSVTTIGRGAFLGCSDLKEFKGKFASNDGRVLIVDKVLKSVAPAAGLTEYTIPDIVTTIGHCAFFECSSLTSVTIPDSVTTIGEGAFAYCGSLTSVTIPDSVTVIGEAAFFDCWLLTSVTIGDSVTEIGGAAFYRCSSLTSVTIPDSVTTIGWDAFGNCSSLTSVTIPDSVTTIGEGAFASCSSLTEFKGKYASEDGRYLIIDGTLNSFAIGCGVTEYTIPDSVTTIGNSAFSACSSLTSVVIPDSVTTIGNSAFSACSSLTSVVIPDSVTTIGYEAFYNCRSLTSVTIPDSVTTIEDCAFARCSSLTSVYCKAVTPPAGGYDMFYDNASGRKIYVPTGSVEVYKSADGWSEYAKDIIGYDF